jgi:hypothetical protein
VGRLQGVRRGQPVASGHVERAIQHNVGGFPGQLPVKAWHTYLDDPTLADAKELDGVVAKLTQESFIDQAFWSPSVTE